jgi:hypothetical protein
MSTSVPVVFAVVIPASAASLLVLAVDVRRGRRRAPARRLPMPSRITAALGAALGVAGFCLASFAGFSGHGHAAQASALSSDETMWVVTAGADPGTGTPGAVVSGSTASPVTLPFAPFTLWGTGVDQAGTYTVVALGPGGVPIPLVAGAWPDGGRATRSLALLDPGAIVDAARASGILPAQDAYNLQLVTADPRVQLHLVLADRPAPVRVTLPTQLVPQPPISGAVAGAQRPAAGSTSAAGTTGTGVASGTPGVGVPATGGGAAVVGGLALLIAGGGCALVSLRLRRGAAA